MITTLFSQYTQSRKLSNYLNIACFELNFHNKSCVENFTAMVRKTYLSICKIYGRGSIFFYNF